MALLRNSFKKPNPRRQEGIIIPNKSYVITRDMRYCPVPILCHRARRPIVIKNTRISYLINYFAEVRTSTAVDDNDLNISMNLGKLTQTFSDSLDSVPRRHNNTKKWHA